MENTILDFLKNYKKKIIPLIEIEKTLPGNIEYIDFANTINEFVNMKILFPIKSHGTNNKKIPLANTYRINKSYFREELINQIASYQLILNSNINLQAYFSLDKKTWEKDLPYIKKVNLYLKKQGLPIEEVTAPERSYQITGNEKWIDENGGREILGRIGLLEKLKISPVPDPLMIAINKNRICNSKEYIHLIVENKATFYALIDDIENTRFSSLVYGAGWKVLGGIAVFEKQLGLTDKDNKIYYFGDLDFEGISIWHGLNCRRPIILGIEFYEYLLKKPCSYGKESQIFNKDAIDSFLLKFNNSNKEKIMNTLKKGGYYPQEGLNKEELQTIWRNIE
ncbi:Wadjet anti-phage system protein JetD domain-containing protein [Proteiniborus sp.]|uniref:Wadjet anti-phage system protein JetD domain-containing protein n=1 Tax=Proteiniborus sp. TaxID=2079015 RepID=UPI00331ADC2D